MTADGRGLVRAVDMFSGRYQQRKKLISIEVETIFPLSHLRGRQRF